MAEKEKGSGSDGLPLVNQYFTLTNESRTNFFDDIACASDKSAFMTSVVASNSSYNITQPEADSNNSIGGGNEDVYKATETNYPKDDHIAKGESEPVVCRIFSSQENVTVNPMDGGSNPRDFFDMIGSQAAGSVSPANSRLSPGLHIDYGLNITSGSNNILQASETFTSGKGAGGECERQRDAWIPCEKTRQVLIAAATAIPGTYFPERELLTMPGVILEEDMVDAVQQVVTHFIGEAETSERKVLTMNDVTQDERGLRELMQAECYRAAVNLTGQLLTIYGQGAGRAGHTSKHTVHSIQLWFTRIALLVKLQAFTLAEAEASVWWDCDRPDLYYQFYPELYGGRLGTLIPFQFRLLLAVLPSFSDKHQEALDRLHSILAVIRKMLRNLENGRSEDGSHLELSAQDRADSKKLWQQREARVLHAVVNVALNLKDYWLAVDVLQMLCTKENVPSQKRALHSALGRVLLRLGDVVGAEKSFQTAQSLKKVQTGTLTGHTADLQELVDRGLMAVAQHCFQDAYDAFHKASLLDPANIMIQNNMSVCQLYLGHLKQALSILCETVRTHPSSALQENVLLNICTLFELESSHSNDNKLALLRLVNKHKGDSICISCLKLQM